MRPPLGHGIGLRPPHFSRILDEAPALGWLEVVTENFMVAGGNPRRVLRRAREQYPVVLHGVSLSIGSIDPLDERYLAELAALIDEVEPALVSDHLCWSRLGGHTVHDLWPMPYTEEALRLVVERVSAVQDRLGRRILLENPSTYAVFRHGEIPEAEFLAAVAERADCGILLDVNNVYVTACNHGLDPLAYLDAIPAERVGYVHLAGHTELGTHKLDTHDAPVCDAVWALYARTVARLGEVPTLIEWDDQIPPLERLLAESARAAEVAAAALAPAATSAPSAGAAPCPSPVSAAASITTASAAPPLATASAAPPLAELQGRFHGMAVAPAIDTTGADELVAAHGALDAGARVGLYARMYRDRLVDALADDYPKLVTALGGAGFRELALAYIVACPPRHHSLRDAGQRLPGFLAASERWPRWLADLARLEWARIDAFDAVDGDALRREDLAELPPEDFVTLELRLVSTARLVELDHAADDVWAAIEGGAPSSPGAAAPPREPRAVLAWRRDGAVIHRALERDEAPLVRRLVDGARFDALCDRLADFVPADDAGARASEFLVRWIDGGILACRGALRPAG